MDKERDAPECVPLPEAVDEIRKSRKSDVGTARQIAKEAHQLGDLDLRLRRPDGSTKEPLDRNFWNAWPHEDPDRVFQDGQVLAQMRRPPGSRRRVQPHERCRIVVTRESLDIFLRPARRAPGAGRPDEYDWVEGKLFFEQEFERRGNPLEEENQEKGWKSISDAAKLVASHLSKDGKEPDLSVVREKVSVWIKEFVSAEN
jgi:hypothetical protein